MNAAETAILEAEIECVEVQLAGATGAERCGLEIRLKRLLVQIYGFDTTWTAEA